MQMHKTCTDYIDKPLILDLGPLSQNQIYRTLPRSRRLRKTEEAKQWIRDAGWTIIDYSRKHFGGRRQFDHIHIGLTIVFPDNRRRDYDNYLKLFQDSLTDSQLIKDDSWHYVSYGYLNGRLSRGEFYYEVKFLKLEGERKIT